MEMRRIGSTSLEVTVLGFGGNALGNVIHGPARCLECPRDLVGNGQAELGLEFHDPIDNVQTHGRLLRRHAPASQRLSRTRRRPPYATNSVPFFAAAISTSATSGRLNSGGGRSPLKSRSRTAVPERLMMSPSILG